MFVKVLKTFLSKISWINSASDLKVKTVTVLEYLILITKGFYNFIFLFSQF